MLPCKTQKFLVMLNLMTLGNPGLPCNDLMQNINCSNITILTVVNSHIYHINISITLYSFQPVLQHKPDYQAA